MSEEYGIKFVVTGEYYDKIKKSFNEQIEDLQQKVEQLEKENDDLKNRLDNEVADGNLRLKEVEQLENIRKEAIEYIDHFSSDEICENITGIAKYLLNILNKGSNKK